MRENLILFSVDLFISARWDVSCVKKSSNMSSSDSLYCPLVSSPISVASAVTFSSPFLRSSLSFPPSDCPSYSISRGSSGRAISTTTLVSPSPWSSPSSLAWTTSSLSLVRMKDGGSNSMSTSWQWNCCRVSCADGVARNSSKRCLMVSWVMRNRSAITDTGKNIWCALAAILKRY